MKINRRDFLATAIEIADGGKVEPMVVRMIIKSPSPPLTRERVDKDPFTTMDQVYRAHPEMSISGQAPGTLRGMRMTVDGEVTEEWGTYPGTPEPVVPS